MKDKKKNKRGQLSKKQSLTVLVPYQARWGLASYCKSMNLKNVFEIMLSK